MKQLKSNLLSKTKKNVPTKNYFLLAVFLIFAITSNATTYYFSSSLGNDSYTSTQAQSQATPWKSISKLNSTILITGDIVLFKSGDTFYGTLTPKASGITFGAYGTGAKPIITGLTTISAWTSLGGNIWEASIPNGLSTLNIVVIKCKFN